MNGFGLFRDGAQSSHALHRSVVNSVLFESIKGRYTSAVTVRINRSTYHERVFAASRATPRIGMESTDVCRAIGGEA